MNDREFKDALRGIDPFAVGSTTTTESTKSTPYVPTHTHKNIYVSDLMGLADKEGYLYLDLYYSDDEKSILFKNAMRAIRRYCKANDIKPITLLQIEDKVVKKLFLKENAKNPMSIDFQYDMKRNCYTINIYAHQATTFVKLGDEKQGDSLFGNLDYEIPFYGECPIYGLMRIKESDLTKAIMYALADSRINKNDYL